MTDINKKDPFAGGYDPHAYEASIYKQWEDSGLFNPDVCIEKGYTDANAEHFSIVLPPPNVTGTLHTGHAIMIVIQDILTRYNRMQGKRTLWLPGVDHASIATQAKVEKELAKKKIRKHDLGREAFLEKVEEFAQESHDTIVSQVKRVGASVDWSREAYTLDDVRNHAVNTMFKLMHDAGLIYQGDRIVNWDPKGQTTISDDEIVRVEETTKFYYFQYGPFVIGTSRPETKFGDKYVVMHPDDKRYAEYDHGQQLEVEWINGPITTTIIKDEAVDPEFGTGVMTITPWHDTADFEIAERHGLDKEQVIDFYGKMLPVVGPEFEGLKIAAAREKLVELLDKKGLVVKIEDNYVHNLATAERGGGIIEPQIKKQWWIAVDKEFTLPYSEIEGIESGDTVTLKQLMQHTVRTKQVNIVPERFDKTYFNWIDNLRDWCISRQIWYGHRIPAWYKEGEETYIGPDSPGEGWIQDEDTLDTWFSSGLWTFSTLGWPDKDAKDFQDYHPTSVLETGYDIIFFWVARMILMTTFATGQVPFRDVYLHGLVRAENGVKMSKSLGNIIDPVDLIDAFGTDALRMALIVGNGPGNDSNIGENKVKAYQKFANKLWNITRFINMNTEDYDSTKTDLIAEDAEALTQWREVITEATTNIDKFQLHLAADKLYQYSWHTLADVLIEETKDRLTGDPSPERESAQHLLSTILTELMVVLHPFMPFLTTAIMDNVNSNLKLSTPLLVTQWPKK